MSRPLPPQEEQSNINAPVAGVGRTGLAPAGDASVGNGVDAAYHGKAVVQLSELPASDEAGKGGTSKPGKESAKDKGKEKANASKSATPQKITPNLSAVANLIDALPDVPGDGEVTEWQLDILVQAHYQACLLHAHFLSIPLSHAVCLHTSTTECNGYHSAVFALACL
jgi:hypothetical protein